MYTTSSMPTYGSWHQWFDLLLCRGATSFVQLALNLRSGDRSAVKFVECAELDAVAAMRRLLAHRACSGHPNIVQLQVRSVVSSLPDWTCQGRMW